MNAEGTGRLPSFGPTGAKAVRRQPSLGLIMLVGAGACFLGAGGLLWARYGPAVFNDVVLSALAWCF